MNDKLFEPTIPAAAPADHQAALLQPQCNDPVPVVPEPSAENLLIAGILIIVVVVTTVCLRKTAK